MIEMFEAAKADGVTGWQISAGYRSYEYQQELFDEQVAEYRAEGFTQEKAVSATRKHRGPIPAPASTTRAWPFDITVAGTIFKGTEQQIWLHKHCWDYGFIIRYQEDKEDITGFLAECWHIRYVGPCPTAPRCATATSAWRNIWARPRALRRMPGGGQINTKKGHHVRPDRHRRGTRRMRGGAGRRAHGRGNAAAYSGPGKRGPDALQPRHRRHGQGPPCA